MVLKRPKSARTITMMTPMFIASFLLLAINYPSYGLTSRPDYIECQTNLECSPGHCCLIGPMRYSIPQCRRMQEEGDVCRPASASAVNLTVSYPDGAQVLLTDVHYILCPCAEGLTCDGKRGICKDTGDKSDTNLLPQENDPQDN